MAQGREGEVAVIFTSARNAADPAGYGGAADAMAALAAAQPGYHGVESVRGADGVGITISYWADEAAARAWRDHPDHVAIREQGRARWYDRYSVTVCTVTRAYDWSRP
ncbi:MAG: antibiotic biosynthesis monooxygenase family protein [Sphingomonas sp.]